MKLLKLTAIPRITLGLVALGVGLLLIFDLLLHLFPNEVDTTRDVRGRVAKSLGLQVAALVQARDLRSVDRTLAAVQSKDPEIRSLGLRRADGALVSQSGDHTRTWSAPAGGGSINEMAVGILSDQQRWGTLEIAFRPIHQRGWADWLISGQTKLFALFSLAATVIFFVYLRRMLQHLDPSAAVPERVRGAFDALTEGVLIVDPNEHILLANQCFQALGPDVAPNSLLGKKASELAWLTPPPVDVEADTKPWLTTMETRQPQYGLPFCITHEDGSTGKVLLHCSPLLDELREVRGCLITVADVTELERTNERLMEVLGDLATSKEQLEQKNTELEELANRDPLSGCLNRRSFFAGLERLFRQAKAQHSDLVCIMADIDHFKKINDHYGHATGDEAIRRFAEILKGSVRQGDLVGRYGGEEFCVVVSGLNFERAVQLADVIRQRLMDERGVDGGDGKHVPMSASFGVTSLRMGARSEAELVDQADRAMYLAKQGGRNRVVPYQSQTRVEAPVVEGALS